MYWTADDTDAGLHLTKQTAGNGVVTAQVFDPKTGRLSQITAREAGAVQSQSYTYDPLGKLISRSDANTALAESFEYDTLNRLTKSIVSLTPTPLVNTFAYSAIGNLTFKSDVGTYSYPAPGDPRPHGVASISGGVINTTFAYDAKGNFKSQRAEACMGPGLFPSARFARRRRRGDERWIGQPFAAKSADLAGMPQRPSEQPQPPAAEWTAPL